MAVDYNISMDLSLNRNIFIIIFIFFAFSLFCNEAGTVISPDFILQKQISLVDSNIKRSFLINFANIAKFSLSAPKKMNSDDNGDWIDDMRRLKIIKGLSIALAAVSFVVGTPLTAVGVAGFVFFVNGPVFPFVAILGLIMGASVITTGIMACLLVYYVMNRMKELTKSEVENKQYLPRIDFCIKLS